MEFATEKQEQAYQRVGTLLREMFGQWVRENGDETPSFEVHIGSRVAYISVFPWTVADDAVIQLVSFVAIGPDLDTDLPVFLLRENESLRFGAFAIDPDGDVAFVYAFPASVLSKEYLNWAVQAVMFATERYAVPIIDRWGGSIWEGPPATERAPT
jgi:hypothetical protein